MTAARLIIGSFILGLTSCAALKQPAPGMDKDFAASYPSVSDSKPARYANGSIYNTETSLPLFETPRARHVGDILTVVLLEKTNAQKKATTRSRKNDKTEAETPAFFGRPIALGAGYNLDFDIGVSRQFDSDSQSVQNNSLVGNITVTVAQVYANGNMLIQGEKWIQINQGKEFVRLAGIVRPQDIKPDNSISSERIANAKIYYGGTGQLNNTNVQGWFAKFLWGPFAPA